MRTIIKQVQEVIDNTKCSKKSAITKVINFYLAKYEASNNNATKAEINKITDFLFDLRRPLIGQY